ncbi:hypothetical protein RvY_02014 [Ramazzottius varieornatus]|uniref:Uncharacterized protein n=1 Tax=Ramazzottius varieornatus TaxID=947166 RepID=A0A1D1UM30_RAMVA|nr:hypothetical protein RvY_02014 [Ramazzottius varieornatus]
MASVNPLDVIKLLDWDYRLHYRIDDFPSQADKAFMETVKDEMTHTGLSVYSVFDIVFVITILWLPQTTLQAPPPYDLYSLGGDPTRTCSNVPFKVVPVTSGTTYTWTATPTGLCSSVSNSTTGILRCSKPQTYLLVGTPATSDPLEVRVNIDYCQDLYAWYAVPVITDNSTSPATTTVDREWKNDYMVFRVWVIGQSLGDLTAAMPTFNIDQYLQLTSSFHGSVTPTPNDAALTRTFRQMGLVPKIKNNYVEQYDIFYYCNTSIPPSWNNDSSYFTFICNRTTNDRYGYHRALNGTPGVPLNGGFVDLAYQTKILVSSVGKQDKFGFTVGDSRQTISRPKFSFPSTLDSKTTLTWVPDTSIRFAPCNTNFAIMCRQNDGCIYTNDEFTTTFPLNVQLGTLSTAKLSNLVVTNSYVIFLTDGSEQSPTSGTLYLIHKNTTTGQATRMDLSVSAFLGLRTHQWCLSGTQNAVRDGYLAWNNDTVVWGTTTGSPKEYWTQQIRSEWLGQNDTLVDVVLDKTPGRPGFYFMTYNTDGAIGTVSVFYYWKDPGVSAVNYANLIFTGPWSFNLSSGVPAFNKFRLHTLFGDDPALLITFTSQMFTASKDPNQTVNAGGKNIAARSYTVTLQAATPTATMDSTRSARFLTGGSMFFITSNNGIYYGNPIAKKVVQLHKVAPSDSALWVDRFDRPFVITIGGSPLAITQKSYINVDHELINLDDSIKLSDCPWSSFIVSGNDPQHNIDVGESFKILGRLWSPVDQKNSISMVLNGPLTVTGASQDKWINMTDISETKVTGDLNEMTRSVLLTNTYAQSFPSFVYRPVSGLPDMVSSLSIHPSKVELSCTKTSQVVVFTQPYCPNGLNIRIVPQNACVSAYPSQISISAEYRSIKATQHDKQVNSTHVHVGEDAAPKGLNK